MVDLRAEAITARLREQSRLLKERGFVPKEPDLSQPAVTARLRVMSALSNMCRELVRAGERSPSISVDAATRGS